MVLLLTGRVRSAKPAPAWPNRMQKRDVQALDLSPGLLVTFSLYINKFITSLTDVEFISTFKHVVKNTIGQPN